MRRFVQALSSGSGLPGSLLAAVHEQLVRLPERYNISAGQLAGVILFDEGRLRVAEMTWGLIPSWEPEPSTKYSTQTARFERAPNSRMYRRAWAMRRCVVAMNGYYKWDRNSSPRQPYFIQSCSGDVLFAAGMWSHWGEGESTQVLSFSILTHANAAIPAPLVADGPLFVEPDRLADWIQAVPDIAGRMLRRMHQPSLEAYAVSRRVANRKLDDYSLLEPAEATEEFEIDFDRDELDEDE